MTNLYLYLRSLRLPFILYKIESLENAKGAFVSGNMIFLSPAMHTLLDAAEEDEAKFIAENIPVMTASDSLVKFYFRTEDILLPEEYAGCGFTEAELTPEHYQRVRHIGKILGG